MRLKTITLLIISLIISVAIFLIFTSFQKLDLPKEYTGHWNGKQLMKVRYIGGTPKYQFIPSPDSVKTMIQIESNGIVTGTFGDATIINCKVSKNRGPLLRALNMATDYEITGTFSGTIFKGDTITRMKFVIPLTLNNNLLTGDVFQRQGMGVYPMTSLILSKKE